MLRHISRDPATTLAHLLADEYDRMEAEMACWHEVVRTEFNLPEGEEYGTAHIAMRGRCAVITGSVNDISFTFVWPARRVLDLI